MNFSPLKKFLSVAVLFILTGGVAARAEQVQRWLFVFDTSSAMKKRLPGTEKEIENMFTTSISGELHAGDSIGVWTFDRHLHTGKFPLTTWEPQKAAEIAKQFTPFLGGQHYSGDTRFAALQPTLNHVIADSKRLTVIIFCDGEDDIHWTPYDGGINETFHKTRSARKKSRLPFVLLLRTQEGKYVGATVNFPPLPPSLPTFPPLPEEARHAAQHTTTNAPSKPAAPVEVKSKVVAPPAHVPQISVPPLIIVGTNIISGTNKNEQPKPPAPTATPKTNLVSPPTSSVPETKTNVVAIARQTNPPTAKVQKTNLISQIPSLAQKPGASSAKTNAVASAPKINAPSVPAPETNPVTLSSPPVATPGVSVTETQTVVAVMETNIAASPTNVMTATSIDTSDNVTRILIYIGGGLFAVAVLLVIFLATRNRQEPHGSLITRSMQDNRRPPDRK